MLGNYNECWLESTRSSRQRSTRVHTELTEFFFKDIWNWGKFEDMAQFFRHTQISSFVNKNSFSFNHCYCIAFINQVRFQAFVRPNSFQKLRTDQQFSRTNHISRTFPRTVQILYILAYFHGNNWKEAYAWIWWKGFFFSHCWVLESQGWIPVSRYIILLKNPTANMTTLMAYRE